MYQRSASGGKAVTADGIYDTAPILRFIINKLKAKPRITKNIRNYGINKQFMYSKSGNRI